MDTSFFSRRVAEARSSRTRYALGLVLLGAFWALPGAEAQGPPGGMAPPPAVTLAPAAIKTVPLSYEYVGLTEASKTVEICARIQGFLETRDFQEGAYIKKGTRLFTIDPRSFKADKEIAEAQVAQAEAQYRLAEQEVKRVQSVRQPGAVAPSDVDQKIAAQASAAAAVRLAKAQLAKAELELSYTELNAPLTGYVGKALKEIGSLVDANLNSLLAEMQQVDPLYVSFKVSESDYLTWKRDEKNGQMVLAEKDKGLWVEIKLLDGTPFDHLGVLDFENVNLDTQTGTVEMRATFENPDRTLKPGQFVSVFLKGWERPNTLTVPQRAVGQAPDGTYVYVVGADNTVERRKVEAGPWAEKDWVILSGLKEGEQVIVEGLTKVQPGGKVNPAADSAAPPAPDASLESATPTAAER